MIGKRASRDEFEGSYQKPHENALLLQPSLFVGAFLSLAIVSSCGNGEPGDNGPGPAVCGNGVVEWGEDCDGDELGGMSCESLGHYGGLLGCTDECEFDTSVCTGYCGDGIVNGPEDCDGDDFGGLTCESLGYTGGELGCTDECELDTSACLACDAEKQVCDGVCVDVSSSLSHCGECGVSCFPRQECANGNCVGHSALMPCELDEALGDKDFQLINVRVPPVGIIPGTDASVCDEEPDQLVEEIGPDLNARVVVYCRTNPRSINAINQLAERGYSGICFLLGGVEAWVDAGYELE